MAAAASASATTKADEALPVIAAEHTATRARSDAERAGEEDQRIAERRKRALTPGSTVHDRLVATNSFGTVFGNDQSFTTTTLLVLDRTPPSISGLSLSHRRFRVG